MGAGTIARCPPPPPASAVAAATGASVASAARSQAASPRVGTPAGDRQSPQCPHRGVQRQSRCPLPAPAGRRCCLSSGWQSLGRWCCSSLHGVGWGQCSVWGITGIGSWEWQRQGSPAAGQGQAAAGAMAQPVTAQRRPLPPPSSARGRTGSHSRHESEDRLQAFFIRQWWFISPQRLTHGLKSLGVVLCILGQLDPLARHPRLQHRQLPRQLLPLVLRGGLSIRPWAEHSSGARPLIGPGPPGAGAPTASRSAGHPFQPGALACAIVCATQPPFHSQPTPGPTATPFQPTPGPTATPLQPTPGQPCGTLTLSSLPARLCCSCSSSFCRSPAAPCTLAARGQWPSVWCGQAVHAPHQLRVIVSAVCPGSAPHQQ